MSRRVRITLAILGVLAILAALAWWRRVARVRAGSAAIPVVAGTREGGGKVRYLPRVIAWDDPSSARVDRVFALQAARPLIAIAREADASLTANGWYLATPDRLDDPRMEPQVVIWQRDPDERLDLSQLWPASGISREQRLYGGIFPAAFLDAPQVIGWTWTLRGHRLQRPMSFGPSILVAPPPPPPPRP